MLADLLQDLTVTGTVSGSVMGVTADTRQIEPGWLFVAQKGLTTDSHGLLDQAIASGACALVVEDDWFAQAGRTFPVPVASVNDTRDVLALLAARFHGQPSQRLALIGVTGTNGKTTTTHLVEAILEEAGRSCGLIGTLGSRHRGRAIPTRHTTPTAPELQALLARMTDQKVETVVMEVSSHALDQSRVAHTRFRVGVFTNLTQDHLDYHDTMENYEAAKALLFERLGPGASAVVNLDDPAGERMARRTRARVTTYAIERPDADLRALDLALHPGGSNWTLAEGQDRIPVTLQLRGRFNVQNALAAIGAVRTLGVDLETCARALARFRGVPGRLEVVSSPRTPFSVYVDYAHTPDGLENILRTVRAFTPGQLHLVFGCGGDRDAAKRPLMGQIASELADTVIVTNDNPRHEDPMAIADQVTATMSRSHEVILDRTAAIRHAMDRARALDAVIIAGKGHETIQTVGDAELRHDDREVVRMLLQEKGWHA